MAQRLPIAPAKRNFSLELAQLEKSLQNITKTTSTVFADKKVVGSEYFQLFGEFIDIQTVISVFPEASKYWLALTPEEKETEVNTFAASLEIPQENARVRVAAVFTGGQKIYAGFAKMWAGVTEIHKAFAKSIVAPIQPASKK